MDGEIEALDHLDAVGTLRRLAVPTATAILGDQLLGIVDTIAIGTLGTAAIAGISGATAIFLVFGIGMFAFGSGLRILGAQAIGAGRSAHFGTIVRSSMLPPLALSALLAAAVAPAATPLMRAFLPAGAPIEASAHYLVLRFLCLVPMTVTGQLIVAFATAGDTRLGLRALAVINAVHIPLLGVLALGFGTNHPLGLAGAGLSSLVAEGVGLAYVLREASKRPEFGIFASWRIDASLVRRAASLSWPEFVFLTLQLVQDPVTIALLKPSGVAVVAAFRALTIVNDATWSIPGSLGDAAEVVVGQRIGARDYGGASLFLRVARDAGMRVCVVAAAFVAVFAWPLSALFTLNAGLATVAALPLAVHVAVTLPLKGFAMLTLAPIRAAGDVVWVMRMGIATVAIGTAGVAFGVLVLHAGLWAFPLGLSLGWIYRVLATVRRLRSGDWKRRAALA